MGCKNSKETALMHRASSVAVPLRPTTPSFHAHDSKFWLSTSGSQANEFREEVPSFVVSDSVDLVGSSDGEPVHGMVSAFTFSFIHTSEAGSNSSFSLSSSSMSEDQMSPRPPESLTFAMTGDPIELQPILEERSGPRDAAEVSASTTAEPAQDAAPSECDKTEPEDESSPYAALTHVGESSVVSESAVTESSELLVNELVASGTSHHSEDSSNNSGDTRRSVDTSELSEGGEYLVTETGAVVRQKSHVLESSAQEDSSSDSIKRESIQEVAAAIVQEVVDDAVSSNEPQQPRDRGELVARSSLQVEPSSTGVFYLSMKTQPPDNALMPSARRPIYAVVGTSTDKGVVLYHVQLMDEVTYSSKWPAPLRRRYSRFSEMYTKLKESKLQSADKLPKLSRAGVVHFVRGRQSKKTIEERQQQFTNVLHYVADHRELHDSAAFQSFLAH
ncbi:uncharacterized protein PITG_13376 [Phytophthora infestans T30-4]|uniref:PX domain-containing protein n=1 Tax=Phytophthora infestans (strain T30-4) TaxID=403677 RepID=D0NLU2_PHYIT|nr:uncharacterized protein PITG_13376 [Phytophthora infestans T30-4]EEY60639.1 conserved hypothetical protein [Phytophthora infestans T30-4]|eukprot:XP_002900012.1 conserved hypothetical protein [Phytophthora infestans T30-4]